MDSKNRLGGPGLVGVAAAWGWLATAVAVPAQSAFYGDPPDAGHAWAVHDRNRPVPEVVTPGAVPGAAPSDAVVLFDGTSLAAWESVEGGRPVPAKWRVADGAFEVVRGTGALRTREDFGDCQLHVEWAAPAVVAGAGQGRGNSGVFFIGGAYEVQVLDSYQNRTYADGQAASVYGQNPPLVNASRPPGEWQSYDIVFHPPRFDAAGAVTDRGSITVFHNGVLVQDHWVFDGLPDHKVRRPLRSHAPEGRIELQDHGDPVRYRNIWVRPVPRRLVPTAEEVRAQREATAERLRGEAAAAGAAASGDPWPEARLLLESLTYADHPGARTRAAELVEAAVAAAAAVPAGGAQERERSWREMLGALRYVTQHGTFTAGALPVADLEAILRKQGLEVR